MAGLVLTALAMTSAAAPILSEIHYNGPASGSDPDEFLELSNAGIEALDLGGWGFASGITFTFATGTTLASGESLVLARSADDFRDVFSAFDGALFDFGGALSNSGETLTLVDATGNTAWSVRYDDAAPWPDSPDGLGDSLQLLGPDVSPELAESWQAATPNPGLWPGGIARPREVSAPGSVALFLAGCLVLGLRQFVGTPRSALFTAWQKRGLPTDARSIARMLPPDSPQPLVGLYRNKAG